MLCEEAAKVQKQVIMDRVQERPPLLDWVQCKQWNCSNATFTDSILAECTPNLKSTKSQKQVTGSGLEDSGLATAIIPPSQIPLSVFCTNTHISKQPTTDTAKDGGKPQHKKRLTPYCKYSVPACTVGVHDSFTRVPPFLFGGIWFTGQRQNSQSHLKSRSCHCSASHVVTTVVVT